MRLRQCRAECFSYGITHAIAHGHANTDRYDSADGYCHGNTNGNSYRASNAGCNAYGYDNAGGIALLTANISEG